MFHYVRSAFSSNPFNLFKAGMPGRHPKCNKICFFWLTIVTWNDPKNWQVPPLCCVFSHFSWSASPATGHVAPAKWWQDQTRACMAFFRCEDLRVHVEIGQVFKGLGLPTSTQSWCLVFAVFAVKWGVRIFWPPMVLCFRAKKIYDKLGTKKNTLPKWEG